MAFAATDVPERIELLLGSYGGFVFDRTRLGESLYTTRVKAEYGYTPTFVERQNVGQAYGDSQQDFFLTVGQDDWSGGQGQRFLHPSNPDTMNRAWRLSELDATSLPGQLTVVANITDVGAILASTACSTGYYGLGAFPANNQTAVYLATSDAGGGHVYEIDTAGAFTDKNAHGAGDASIPYLTTDGRYLYIAGSGKIRKWSGSAYSDFSASGAAGRLAFLANVLYSCDGGHLYSYSTGGTQTTLFTWVDAPGVAVGTCQAFLAYGGELFIYRSDGSLWVYDGTDTYQVAQVPGGVGYDMSVVQGMVFVSGAIKDTPGGLTRSGIPVVYRYLNGSLNEVWRGLPVSKTAIGLAPASVQAALCEWAGKLLIADATTSAAVLYDPVTTATSELFPVFSDGAILASAPAGLVYIKPGGNTNPELYYYPASSLAATGTLLTSLIDFDNSLPKYMRGIKIVWEGSGSVDLSYQLDAVTGSYTALRTGAVSGTEYTLPANTTGQSISVKAVLNTSAGSSPALKRVYARAAPIQQAFKRRHYILDMSGNRNADPPSFVTLLDGTQHPMDGDEMRAALESAITATAPFSITDRTGTFTGIIEPGTASIQEVRSEYNRAEYRAEIDVREV